MPYFTFWAASLSFRLPRRRAARASQPHIPRPPTRLPLLGYLTSPYPIAFPSLSYLPCPVTRPTYYTSYYTILFLLACVGYASYALSTPLFPTLRANARSNTRPDSRYSLDLTVAATSPVFSLTTNSTTPSLPRLPPPKRPDRR